MADPAVLANVVPRAEELLGKTLYGVETLPGGHSGITLVGTVGGGDQRVVLKVAPLGRPATGRHDVLRQARGIAYAAGAIPVPTIFVTSQDEPQFCVMSFEAGEATEPALDAARSGDDVELVARRFDVATELLGRLHLLDPSGLMDAGAGATSPADELGKWERTLRAVDPSFVPAGDKAYELLRDSAPTLWRAALVHGDYRLGNILFVEDKAEAVVDWEIWTVGDPRVDLGWYLTFCDPSDFPVIGQHGRKIPSIAELVGRYEQATGWRVPDLWWFLAFGAFKMGVIMAHNLERHRSGRHHDPYQESLPPTIEHLLSRATALAESGERGIA